jgi:hypothetical protein
MKMTKVMAVTAAWIFLMSTGSVSAADLKMKFSVPGVT